MFLSNIKLADPEFNIPDEFEMLIEIEIFYNVLKQPRIEGYGTMLVSMCLLAYKKFT